MQKSSLKYRRAKIKGQIMQFSQFSLFIVFNIVLLLLSCCFFFFLQAWFWWPRAKTEMTWIILINIYILKYNMRKMFFSQWHKRHEGKNLSAKDVWPSGNESRCSTTELHMRLMGAKATRLFTVPYVFVRSFRYTASYRHGYCTEGAGVGDYNFLPNHPRPTPQGVLTLMQDGSP